MKKEIKHNCPEGMEYSDKRGRCINPHLDDKENVSEGVPTKSLRFPKTLGNVGFPLAGKKKEKK